ncbi:MAG: hypothetical protein ABIB72_03175 [Candidatus Falkowbacteria bacterium]
MWIIAAFKKFEGKFFVSCNDAANHYIGGVVIMLVRVVNQTWTLAVDRGGYDGKYIDPKFTEADLPLFPVPVDNQTVKIDLCRQNYGMLTQNCATTTQAWLNVLDYGKKSGKKFAHPLVVLIIGSGENTKDEQLLAPIFTIWKSPHSGLLWCLFLSGDIGYRGSRFLFVCRVSLNSSWSAFYRAAAVAK